MRYGFNLFKGYVWRDMLTNGRYFWGMWGVTQTLKFLWSDTHKALIAHSLFKR